MVTVLYMRRYVGLAYFCFHSGGNLVILCCKIFYIGRYACVDDNDRRRAPRLRGGTPLCRHASLPACRYAAMPRHQRNEKQGRRSEQGRPSGRRCSELRRSTSNAYDVFSHNRLAGTLQGGYAARPRRKRNQRKCGAWSSAAQLGGAAH